MLKLGGVGKMVTGTNMLTAGTPVSWEWNEGMKVSSSKGFSSCTVAAVGQLFPLHTSPEGLFYLLNSELNLPYDLWSLRYIDSNGFFLQATIGC